MDTIFMNSKNSKIFELHEHKLNLNGSGKYVALSNLSICYSWQIYKKVIQVNNFKISVPTWNEKFELRDDHILY